MAKKLVRVELEYEDGTRQECVGEEAEKWECRINSACAHLLLRGFSLGATEAWVDLPKREVK